MTAPQRRSIASIPAPAIRPEYTGRRAIRFEARKTANKASGPCKSRRRARRLR
jgi:hypothetical protein